VQISLPEWDASTQTVLVDSTWDMIPSREEATLIYRDGTVYQVLEVESSGYNRTTATVKYRYRGLWPSRMKRTPQPSGQADAESVRPPDELASDKESGG
jgi:hypothetical protein